MPRKQIAVCSFLWNRFPVSAYVQIAPVYLSNSVIVIRNERILLAIRFLFFFQTRSSLTFQWLPLLCTGSFCATTTPTQFPTWAKSPSSLTEQRELFSHHRREVSEDQHLFFRVGQCPINLTTAFNIQSRYWARTCYPPSAEKAFPICCSLCSGQWIWVEADLLMEPVASKKKEKREESLLISRGS